ncbi:Rho1 [Aphelenchoides avenae]|nr:Rho1 [Aphelenchus avenae]
MRHVRKKLVAVGDDNCGKTSLLAVFRGESFPESTLPTKVLQSVALIEVDGISVEFTLCETADQGGYKLRQLCYEGADVVLICFSVDRPASLAHVSQKWAGEVRQFCPNVPIILVANKTEIHCDQGTDETSGSAGVDPVTSEQGRAVAEEIGAYAYVECSAKNNHGVRDVFEKAAMATLARKAIKKRKSCCIM